LNVRVLVDRVSEPDLKGAVIDYKESMMGGSFSIKES
jgi:Fe-S cluster assembly iron-binding protein IscA